MKPNFFLLVTVQAFMMMASLLALETTITGGKMELRDEGEIVNFSNGVILKRGIDTLKANHMQTNRGRTQIKAKENVELTRIMSSTETIVGLGDEGFYDTKRGEGYLLRGKTQARVLYTQVLSSTMTRKIDIVANKFDFMRASSTVIGTGDVYGKTIDPSSGEIYEFWSDRLDYDNDTDVIVLSGTRQSRAQQLIGKDKRVIEGDILTYTINQKKMEAEGKAQAIFMDDSDSSDEIK